MRGKVGGWGDFGECVNGEGECGGLSGWWGGSWADGHQAGEGGILRTCDLCVLDRRLQLVVQLVPSMSISYRQYSGRCLPTTSAEILARTFAIIAQ